MQWIEALQAAFLGIVEGLTEFLPVSSTGHLIIAGDLIGFHTGPSADTFYIAIQAGAIVAVCWHYRERIFAILRNLFVPGKEQRLAVNTVIAFIPAAVAAALIVGGILILWIERAHEKSGKAPRVASMDDMTWKDAVGVGLMQCFALIPGTSRSGATIIGGLVLGLSRKAATEFSFFLAIPTIFGATVYDLYKSREVLSVDVLPSVAIGFVVSFFSAILVVRWLLRFVSTNDFRLFGWYRIVFGIVVLALCAAGLADF